MRSDKEYSAPPSPEWYKKIASALTKFSFCARTAACFASLRSILSRSSCVTGMYGTVVPSSDSLPESKQLSAVDQIVRS